MLARITPTGDVKGLRGADLLIEAVPENAALKVRVIGEVLAVLAPDAVLGTNTSTLPITGLAADLHRPADVVGLHFFSPVERMDLVEIVVGAQTSDATLAKAFDVVQQLRKTPIVVNDGRGFFTSRVILTRLLEAASMLGEGISPASVEQASLQAGYPMGTLALLDEVAVSLPHTIHGQFRDEAAKSGTPFVEHPGDAVLAVMVEQENRSGRAAGAGFYDYADGQRGGLWAGLEERVRAFHARRGPPGTAGPAAVQRGAGHRTVPGDRRAALHRRRQRGIPPGHWVPGVDRWRRPVRSWPPRRCHRIRRPGAGTGEPVRAPVHPAPVAAGGRGRGRRCVGPCTRPSTSPSGPRSVPSWTGRPCRLRARLGAGGDTGPGIRGQGRRGRLPWLRARPRPRRTGHRGLPLQRGDDRRGGRQRHGR